MPRGRSWHRFPTAAEITGWLSQLAGPETSTRATSCSPWCTRSCAQLAARLLQRERRDHTLEPNAVVNELYLRLIGSQPISYQDRAHFFAIAAQTMRRILIDHARARVAGKRGGEQRRVAALGRRRLGRAVAERSSCSTWTRCCRRSTPADPRAARVVELRFFGGLREEDVAEVLQRVGHHGQARLEGGARLARGAAAVTRQLTRATIL